MSSRVVFIKDHNMEGVFGKKTIIYHGNGTVEIRKEIIIVIQGQMISKYTYYDSDGDTRIVMVEYEDSEKIEDLETLKRLNLIKYD